MAYDRLYDTLLIDLFLVLAAKFTSDLLRRTITFIISKIKIVGQLAYIILCYTLYEHMQVNNRHYGKQQVVHVIRLLLNEVRFGRMKYKKCIRKRRMFLVVY